ncbi:MAG: hypothetical protein M1812_004459 [Candelaria pacifica]|nr:MAG: hypothetical protein M1812_004459 [Candelaria pacifica]
MSSSPGLPSPSLLLRNNGFLTASSLLQVPAMDTGKGKLDGDGDRAEGSNDVRAKTVALRKDKTGLSTQSKRARAGRPALSSNTPNRAQKAAVKNTKVIVAEESYVGKAVKNDAIIAVQSPDIGRLPKPKLRSRVKKTESQSRIAVDSITKPSVRLQQKRAPVVEVADFKTERSAKEISNDVTHQQEATHLKLLDDERSKCDGCDLLLDAAARRRIDWTPPIDTMTDTSNEHCESSQHNGKSTGELLSTFIYSGFSDETKAPMSTLTIAGEAFRKRRRIDLVEKPQIIDLTSSDKKPRSVKKKPRTITERATATYMAANPTSVAPIPQYVTEQGLRDGPVSLPCAVVMPSDAKSLSKRTIAGTASTRPRKSARREIKKQKVVPPTLFYPMEARKEIDDQQLLFGTSSQLAEADSSASARDSQQAISASERDISLATSVSSNADSHVACFSLGGIDKPLLTPNTNLWSAAARGSDGLQYSGSETSDSWTCGDDEIQAGLQGKPTDYIHHVSKRDKAPPRATPSITARTVPRQAPTARSVREPPRVKGQLVALPDMQPDESLTNALALTVPDTPEFEGFPTSRLVTELKSYGFKPVKSREQMILLLKKCQEGKHRVALQALHSNRLISNPSQDISSLDHTAVGPSRADHLTSKTSTLGESLALTLPKSQASVPTGSLTKRPRGRPRKNLPLSTSTGVASGQSSSQTPIVSTCNRTRPKLPKRAQSAVREASETYNKSNTPPMPQCPSPSSLSGVSTDLLLMDDTLMLTPTAVQAHLFESITKAVTAAPPSTDVKKPTWHEKILMYDPIVLEDLSTWLNTQGLASVGVDTEVGATEVREWCERNSVCCLWKENLGGGARSRR